MSITIRPPLETQLRAKAEAEGMSVEQYIEHLLQADRVAEQELEGLAKEGLDSGNLIDPASDYWEEKHRRLDEQLGKSQNR